MLDHWLHEPGKVLSCHSDLEEVARNVIAFAGFGQQQQWLHRGSDNPDKKDSAYSSDAVRLINTIMSNLLKLYLIPKLLIRKFYPDLYKAVVELGHRARRTQEE